MGKYFLIEELTYSATAEKLKINNTPTSTEVRNNLLELISVLDEIREGWTTISRTKGWGSGAIIVNSGYRCDALNKAIGGSLTSAHSIGAAADIEPKNQRNKEFFDFLNTYLLQNNIPFDQLINEKPVNGIPSWIHIGLKNRKGEQRQMVFTLN